MSHFSVASLIQLGFSYTLTPTLAKVHTIRQTEVNVDNVESTLLIPPQVCLLRAHTQAIDRRRYYDHCCPTNSSIRKVRQFYMTMKVVLLAVPRLSGPDSSLGSLVTDYVLHIVEKHYHRAL